MNHGAIEAVTTDGIVEGWARDGAQPCHIQILHDGAPVAEAMATIFRPDLLRANYSHGHLGFAARLRKPLPTGPLWLALHLPRLNQTLPTPINIPPHSLRGPATVETLLQDPPAWTAADLLAAPACLDWEANLTRLGPPRFVDAIFRFTLGRWPTKAELRLHTANLSQRRFSPQDLLLDLLRSPERAESNARILSPFDPGFPFAL